MKISEEKLEEKSLYRLIKALYFLSLFALSIFILVMIYSVNRPISYIDQEKSKINCIPRNDGYHLNVPEQEAEFRQKVLTAGGSETELDAFVAEKKQMDVNLSKSYTLDNSHIYLSDKVGVLTKQDDAAARKLCAYAIVDDFANKYQTPDNVNYQLNLVESNRGSWGTVIFWSLVALASTYGILNFAKETLCYIFFGKDFSWVWLINIRNVIKKIESKLKLTSQSSSN